MSTEGKVKIAVENIINKFNKLKTQEKCLVGSIGVGYSAAALTAIGFMALGIVSSGLGLFTSVMLTTFLTLGLSIALTVMGVNLVEDITESLSPS